MALNYTIMNKNPQKYNYYSRFIDNEGDVNIPGYDSITGQHLPKVINSVNISKLDQIRKKRLKNKKDDLNNSQIMFHSKSLFSSIDVTSD